MEPDRTADSTLSSRGQSEAAARPERLLEARSAAAPTAVLTLSLVLAASATQASASTRASIAPPEASAAVPTAVAPGATDRLVEIETACPTFLWAGAGATEELQLVVYELPYGSGRSGWESGDSQNPSPLDDVDELEPVLDVRLPGSAPGWSPALERCLEPGGEYAWAVRGLEGSPSSAPSSGGWSETLVFRVAESGDREGAGADETAESEPAAGPRGGSSAGSETSSAAELPGEVHSIRVTSSASAPDPASAPVSLRLSDSLALAASSAVIQDGELMLWSDGSANTALGRSALSANTTGGTSNTALGSRALANSISGSFNVAVGHQALEDNQFAGSSVAVGYRALQAATEQGNVAIGLLAGARLATGAFNIFIGNNAGSNLAGGSDNILIGNKGGLTLNNEIRIGDPNLHFRTILVGDVALGGITNPSNRLHVVESISGSQITTHVAQIHNTNRFSNADVLALKVGINTPTGANNFVSFYGGSNNLVGEIQGNSAGGVSFVSSSADYAEYLQRLDPDEALAPGDVVGLFGDRVSRRTRGADRVLVVSGKPLVLGNDPGEERRPDYEPIALLGQVQVRVRGAVRVGDLLLASGGDDGTAIALAPEAMTPARLGSVLGRVLAVDQLSAGAGDGPQAERSAEESDESRALALVGLPDSALLTDLLAALEERLEGRLERLSRELCTKPGALSPETTQRRARD